jgi:hypothetical protein
VVVLLDVQEVSAAITYKLGRRTIARRVPEYFAVDDSPTGWSSAVVVNSRTCDITCSATQGIAHVGTGALGKQFHFCDLPTCQTLGCRSYTTFVGSTYSYS